MMPHRPSLYHRGSGLAAATLALCALAGVGCGPTGPQTPVSGEQQKPDTLPYDPGRAFLELDELEADGVVIPQPTAQARPLSGRGARQIEKAVRLEAEQRYTEAVLELERALHSDPDSQEVHLQLARVLRAAGSMDRSRTHLQRALALNPDDVVVHYLLAQSALDENDAPAAIRELRIALRCANTEAEPDFRGLVLYRLGESLQREGYLSAALEVYGEYEQAAAALAGQEDVARELTEVLRVTGGSAGRPTSAIYEQLGQFDRAADALARACRNQAPDSATRARLIGLLSKAERHAEAVDQAGQLVEQDASMVEVLLEAYRSAGRPEGALSDLADLAARRPDDQQFVLIYANALEALDQQERAEAELKRFVEAHLDQLGARWRLFDMYASRQAWGQALTLAAQAVEADASAAPAGRSKVLGLTVENCRALLEAADAGPAAKTSTLYLLGCAALRAGDPGRATAFLERVIAAAPDFAAARSELAAVYNSQFRWSDTLALLTDDGGAKDRTARSEWLIGQAYDGLDEAEPASVRYNSAARLNPRDPAPLKALARLYERNGDVLRATRQYRATLDLDPVDEQSREELFGLYLRTGDREAAAAQLDELRKISASPNRVARCLALLQNNPMAPDFERLRRTLMQAMEASQPDARSLTLLAVTFLDEAQYEAALGALERAVELAPDDIDALVGLEYAYRMTLQFEKSAETLRNLLRRHPNRSGWIEGLVGVLVTEQDFDGAVEVIRQQLARGQADPEALTRYRELLVEVLRSARRFDEQIATVKSWQTESPDDASLRVSLLGAYLVAERYEEALAVVEPWYAEEPDNGPLREQLVDLLVEVGQADRAFQVVLDALASDPDNDGLLLSLVRALASAERHDDALELATNCVVGSANALAYQVRMLEVYSTAGRHDEAVRLIGEMLHQVEDDSRQMANVDADGLQQALAQQLIQAERYNEAQSRLTRWAEGSNSPAAKARYLTLLSTCHQVRGQLQQATEALEQAYSLRPLDPVLNNDLAYHWADAGVRLDEAESLLRYAVAQQPRNDAFLDSLGWVMYKKGDIDGALKWLTRAIGAGAGDDPVIRFHLGDAYWRTGSPEQALENWQAAERFAQQRLEVGSVYSLSEFERVLEGAKSRIGRVESGRDPEVAPLGEGVEPATEQGAVPAEASSRAPQPIG